MVRNYSCAAGSASDVCGFRVLAELDDIRQAGYLQQLFDRGFDTPSGVAVDSVGNVYVADTNNHRIQKRDAASGSWSALNANEGGPGNGPESSMAHEP